MEIYKLSPDRVAVPTSFGEYAEWESRQSSDLICPMGVVLQSDFINNSAIVTLFSPFALGMYQRSPLNFLTVVTKQSSFSSVTYSSYRAAINGHKKHAKNAANDSDAISPPPVSKSRVCNKCGCVFRSNGYMGSRRCSVCVSKANRKTKSPETIEAVQSRLTKFKMNTGCATCGYSKSPAALEFHHTASKKFHIIASDIKKYPVEEVINELSTCVLLCRNCHSEVHHNVAQSPSPFGEQSAEIVCHLLGITDEQKVLSQ